jgi:hypothetical protein
MCLACGKKQYGDKTKMKAKNLADLHKIVFEMGKVPYYVR